MKIALAFDSFKGSLSSGEVADAFEQGLKSAFPECTVSKILMADGGEGTMEALLKNMGGGKTVATRVSDPLDRPIWASYGLTESGRTAIIEMAEASGLTLLAESERNPMLASSRGTGELMADALNRGCRRIILGIGGSATCDGGTGMLTALGMRFLDSHGRQLRGCGESLSRIRGMDSACADSRLRMTEIIVACDVANPLYGKNGAAHVFAPQKGATDEMVLMLDKGLRNLAKVIREHTGRDISQAKGAGAAGGMGAALMVIGGRLMRGTDIVLGATDFDRVARECDIVFTGEGRIDRQTLMGKAPKGILMRASAHGTPVVAIGGEVAECDELKESGFAAVISINRDGLPRETAMRHDVATENVRRMGERIGKLLYICENNCDNHTDITKLIFEQFKKNHRTI